MRCFINSVLASLVHFRWNDNIYPIDYRNTFYLTCLQCYKAITFTSVTITDLCAIMYWKWLNQSQLLSANSKSWLKKKKIKSTTMGTKSWSVQKGTKKWVVKVHVSFSTHTYLQETKNKLYSVNILHLFSAMADA